MKKVIDVVVVEPIYPINLGIVARTIMNFSLGGLVLVNPNPDVKRRSIRYSARGVEILHQAKVFPSLDDLIGKYDLLVGTSSKESRRPSLVRHFLTPNELTNIIEGYERVALVFGRENIGLKNSELVLMDINVKVPTNDQYPTLNLAVSVGVMLYEVHSTKFQQVRRDLAPNEKIDLLLSTVQRLMQSLSLDQSLINGSAKALQNVMARGKPVEKEVMTLQAAFNKVLVLSQKKQTEKNL